MTAPDSGEGHDATQTCGARGRTGKPCGLPAGWGTPHVGSGRCRKHGGSTPNHLVKAGRERAERAVATFGLPVEIDPRDALLQEVHRTAGHVAWLAELVADLQHGGSGYRREEWVTPGEGEDVEYSEVYVPLSGLKQLSTDGKYEKPSVWVELYQRERRHLREVCRDAIAAGIAERQVRLAEQQGTILAAVIRGILGDLGLTPEQLGLVPEVVPRHLRSVTGTAAS